MVLVSPLLLATPCLTFLRLELPCRLRLVVFCLILVSYCWTTGRRAIGGRGETRVTLEYLVETRKVTKPDVLSHLGNGDVTGGQKHFGSLKTYPQEVIAEGNAEDRPE